MKEDFIEKKINENVDIEFSFDEISNRIEYPHLSQKKKNKFVLGSLTGFLGAASVAMITFALVTNIQIRSSNNESNQSKSETAITSSVIIDTSILSSNETEPPVVSWDDKNIIQKYPTFILGETTYTVSSKINGVNSKYVDSFLQDINIEGFDAKENKTYTISAKMYKIVNIKLNSACAIKFPDANEYFTYVNKEYYFSSIEDVIVGTNMLDYTLFNSFYYIKERTANSKTIIQYDDFDDKIVFDMLLSDTTITNSVPEHNSEPVPLTSSLGGISLYNEALNIFDYLMLYDNGYVSFNLYGTTCAFYIGENKIYRFIEYAKEYFTYNQVYIEQYV